MKNAVLVLSAFILLIGCSGGSIKESKSIKDNAFSSRINSSFILLEPGNIAEDDIESFDIFLSLLKTDLEKRGVPSSTFMKKELSLNNSDITKAFKDSRAKYMIQIMVVKTSRRSDVRWIQSAEIETTIRDVEAGREVWKSQMTLEHTWSGWGTFGEKGALALKNELIRRLSSDGMI